MARSGGLSELFMGMLLQGVFGQASSVIGSIPTDSWFALSPTSVDPANRLYEPATQVFLDDAGNVTQYATTNIADTGYDRVNVPLKDYEWWMESGIAAVVNKDEIRFPEALQDWGYIRYWAMLDAPERGRVLAYGGLRRVVRVLAGDTPVIAPGAVHIALDSYTREW
jgi:hypothetical protein